MTAISQHTGGTKIKELRKTNPLAYFLLALIVLFLLFRAYVHSQEDNVREAVVRANLSSARTSVIFVTIDGRDPGNNFIRRFSNSKILVRKESQGAQRNDSFGDSWGTYFVDKMTRQKGQRLSIQRISWWGPLIAQVEVSHPGVGERYTVVLSLRGWIVAKKERTWIH